VKYIFLVLFVSSFTLAGDLSNINLNKNFINLGIFAILCTKAMADSNNNYEIPPYTFSNEATIGWAWWQITTGAFAVLSVASSFVAPWYYWKKIQNDVVESLEDQIKVLEEENEWLEANAEYCGLAKSVFLDKRWKPDEE
jgi:hypothetical protein